MQFILESLSYVLIVIIGLLPIANPFSTAPVFLTVSSKLDDESKKRLLKLTCKYMFLILITFLLAGALILSFFGISVYALRYAGGLIIIVLVYRMLFPSSLDVNDQLEVNNFDRARGLAFTPLAMPMLSGPGSIAIIISMAADISKAPNILTRLLGYFLVGLGIFITVFICYIVLKSSTKITKILGPSGIDALTRIMGFILICLGVEFMASGVNGYF